MTAPDDKILSGITRKYIIEICRDINIRIDYRCVPADSLKNYDAVFMTGTSPMVLQFCCINDVNFKVPVPLIEKLRTLYVEKAMDSVLKFTEGR